MIEHDLSARLRQRSRTSGILVGLSMALTIIIALTAFIWLYVRLGPYLGDFIPRATEVTTPTPGPAAAGAETPASEEANASESQPTPTPLPSPTPVWQPTHRVAEGTPVNFRSGPGTDTEVVQVLEPGTPLMFLGEQEQAAGATWLHLALEDGTDGWIRTIDLEPLEAP